MKSIVFKISNYRVRIIVVATIGNIDSTTPQTNNPCKSLDLLRIQWRKITEYAKSVNIKFLFFFYLHITIYDIAKEQAEVAKTYNASVISCQVKYEAPMFNPSYINQ